MTYIPQLTHVANYRDPINLYALDKNLSLPIVGAFVRKTNPTDVTFSKTGAYGWTFWVKFDQDNNEYRQIIQLGTLATNGYRIVKDRFSGSNIISFQECTSNYTADKWYYPTGFDITAWHHICVTWTGNSATSVTTNCYINGVLHNTKAASITWANAVETTGILNIGYDWEAHTVGGNIADVQFYKRHLYSDDVVPIMKNGADKGTTSHWTFSTGFDDSVGSDDVTPFSSASIVTTDLEKIYRSNWQSGLQFNYGQKAQHGMAYYSAAETDDDLTFMWNMGCRKIRCASSPATYATGLEATKQVALDAKAKGFYVIVVGLPTGMTDSSWSTSITEMTNLAVWAESNDIDELCLGNEYDAPWASGVTLTDRINKIKALCTTVKAVYNGNVSFTVGQDGIESQWIAAGKGPLDKLGYNCYGSNASGDYTNFTQLFNDFKSKITTMHNAFGNDMYVSEWNIAFDWDVFPASTSQQDSLIAERLTWLRTQSGVTDAFFHTFRWSTVVNDQFALIKCADGRLRSWIDALATYVSGGAAATVSRSVNDSNRVVNPSARTAV